jgi:ABC-type transport system involved in multi-copper enzyme maturation permease subunit
VNRHIAKALLDDAFYQVLDNKVFRLLVILSIGLVLPTFLIGFREDGIHVLFGWKTFTYGDLFSGFGGSRTPATRDLHIFFVQTFQSLIVQNLAGTIGLVFCIAATAFFVPRMLEKGAADTLFSKPVSRIVLLLARYVAGLLFVGVLSFVLVLGMHIGLLVTSGYSDPGFLWSALTLVYIFALVHAFSTLVAVFTRSSVAAILFTLMLYTVNGCVQPAWVQKEWRFERRAMKVEADDESEKTKEEPPTPAIIAVLIDVLDTWHWIMPKTNDADVLTVKLRTVVAGREQVLFDPTGKLSVVKDPPGLVRQDKSETVELAREPAVWTANGDDGAEVARITISRRSRSVEKPDAPEKARKANQSANAAANDFLKSLAGKSEVQGKPQKTREPSAGREFSMMPSLDRQVVRWSENGPHGLVSREHAFFSVDDWMYEVDSTLQTEWQSREDRGELVTRFFEGFHIQRDSAADLEPKEWYEKKFGWTAPFKYNAFVSLGTSIAFALILLGIAGWRLKRIDF